MRSQWTSFYASFGYGCYEFCQITGTEVSVWWVKKPFLYFLSFETEIPFLFLLQENKPHTFMFSAVDQGQIMSLDNKGIICFRDSDSMYDDFLRAWLSFHWLSSLRLRIFTLYFWAIYFGGVFCKKNEIECRAKCKRRRWRFWTIWRNASEGWWYVDSVIGEKCCLYITKYITL